MPLGGQDILLVIRATDQASSTISRVAGSFGAISAAQATAATNTLRHGAALTILGVGLMAVGKQGFDALKSWGSAAMEYNHAASLTLTQIDDIGVSLEDVKRIGREVAMEIPAPFEEMQVALYDIFSSMDVGVEDAQRLLTAFARGAVAGQTDVQTAGRGTIAVMNAFKIPFADVNKVMDTQFNLVAEGVGTYEEFANVIGRVSPSAVRMGQTFEDVAGALAFLTRNGQSTEMASASLGRAFDALSKSKVQNRLEDMGIASRDAAGNFRPLVDIMRDMNNKFRDMSKPEIANALEDLFKGAGGTIQARRFFDTVFQNFEEFESLTFQMKDSAGEMDAAYAKMFESPQTKLQLFNNRLEILRTELGDHLLPIMTKVVDAGIKFLGWLEELDPGVKKNIVQFVAFASAAAVVVGAVFTLIGVFLIIKATLALAAVSFGAVLAAAAGIIVVLALVAAAGYLIYKNWDTVGPIVKQAFETIRDWTQIAWEKLQEFAAWVMTWLPGMWDEVQQKSIEFWGWIEEHVFPLLEALANFVTAALSRMRSDWDGFFAAAMPVVVAFVAYFQLIWPALWTMIQEVAGVAFNFVKQGAEAFLAVLTGLFNFFAAALRGDWSGMWEAIKQITSGAWQWITNIWNSAWDLLFAIARGAFNALMIIFRAGWDAALRFVQEFPGRAAGALMSLAVVLPDIANRAMSGFLRAIQNIAGDVIGFVMTIPGKIRDALDVGSMMVTAGINMIEGFINGIKAMASRAASAAVDVARKAYEAVMSFLGANSPSKLFMDVGRNTVEGMVIGVRRTTPQAERAVEDMARRMAATQVTLPVGWETQGAGVGTPLAGSPFAGSTFDIAININGEGMDAEEVAEEVEKALEELLRELLTGPRP